MRITSSSAPPTQNPFFFFFTLVRGPSSSLSPKFSDARALHASPRRTRPSRARRQIQRRRYPRHSKSSKPLKVCLHRLSAVRVSSPAALPADSLPAVINGFGSHDPESSSLTTRKMPFASNVIFRASRAEHAAAAPDAKANADTPASNADSAPSTVHTPRPKTLGTHYFVLTDAGNPARKPCAISTLY